MKKIKLIAIVGPTASGKTKLAVEMAKRFSGEVVSADSMQIYQGLSIATAKPTMQEMEGIPHHLIDFLPLTAPFNVSDYVSIAREKIHKIQERGNLPIIAGGTGLYIQSLIDHVSFTEEDTDPEIRKRLMREMADGKGTELYARLQEIDPKSAEQIHPNNQIRVVRALEIYESTGITMTEQKERSRCQPSPYDCCMIGLNYRNRQTLYDRINCRVDIMMEEGLLDEVRSVYEHGNLKTAYNAIGYKELIPYLEGKSSLDACIDKIKQESRRYAKRQLTWFRRDTRINWIWIDEFSSFEEVVETSEKTIAKFVNL